MAVSTDTIKNTYPLPVYNYRVEIAGTSVAFSEVSGINITIETTTYKESQTESGLTGPKVFHMPAQGTPVNVTFKKGFVRGGVSLTPLYNWLNSTQINQVEKKDIFVRLCDEEGNPLVSWQIVNAFPTKLEAPTFDATSNDVAIESLEVMGDAVQISEA